MAANNLAEQVLDENAFQHFVPLLAASQRYAKLSGCRFRSASFDGIPHDHCNRPHADDLLVVGSARYHDSGPRLAAKINAAPAVNEFRTRLRAGDPSLTNEMERAHSIVMNESVRNAMVSTFKALDMFPPADLATHVDHGDCKYEDVSAPLPVIAQRLYNDQTRRVRDVIGEHSRVERHAKTAAFLVDFASESDVELPPMPQMQQDILREFAQRTGEFTQPAANQSHHKIETFLEGLGAGTVAHLLQQEARRWWTKRQTPSADRPQGKLEALESFIEDSGAGSAGQLPEQEGQQLSTHWRTLAWPLGAVAVGAAAVLSGSVRIALSEGKRALQPVDRTVG
mmetsp:Transcript_63361/g.125313  ORF Transcript_63361/g.125313 Transcript_63361/m.125313 type:complete len:340 (+) Transcript_63361:70-1089(+)